MMRKNYDVRLRLASVMMVVGPSQSGKTHFVTRLIKELNIFKIKPKFIYWYYGEIHPNITVKNVNYIKGLPYDLEKIQKNSIIILDDLMIEGANNNNITNLFTRISHHKNCFVIYITQNMYHHSTQNRTRNLNVHYLILFKNVRDTTIINTLARQMYPGSTNFLVESFRHATSIPYQYLFLDFHTDTIDELRVRGNIFIGDMDMIVYINILNKCK